MDIPQLGEGYVTYFAAFGLVALGLYSTFKGDFEKGMTLIIAGIGLAGGRRAIDRVPGKVADHADVVAETLVNKIQRVEDRECADKP